jgi:hypothetical protein
MVNAKEMCQIIEDFLKTNAGTKQVTVDGQTIVFDRVQALEELKYWHREAARQAGSRRPFRGIDIGSAW